jgi:hypothetical protein
MTLPATPHIIIPCATARDQGAVAALAAAPEGQAFSWHLLPADFFSAQNRWNTCVGEEVARARRLAAELAGRLEPGTLIAAAPSNDFSAIVAGIVAEDGRGFSLGMLPILRCRHKYYQRLATAPHMLAGPGLWLEDRPPAEPAIAYPFYAKLPLSSFGIGGRLIETAAEFAAYRPYALRLGREMAGYLRGVPESAFDALPLLGANGFLTETPVHLDQVTVMGRCVQGETVCDAVVETVFFPGTRNVRCFRWPARLPAFAVRQVLEAARQAVAKLGFRHGLWNAEVWWGGDRARPFAEIIEINPRPATYFWQMLRMGADYPLYQVMAEMAVGGPGSPPGPPLRAGRVEQRAVTTAGEGRAGELVDYAALRRLEEDGATVVYLFAPEDAIKQLSPFPVIVAEVVAWAEGDGVPSPAYPSPPAAP